MYANDVEFGYQTPHNFDYVVGHIFFDIACNEHYIKTKTWSEVKRERVE